MAFHPNYLILNTPCSCFVPRGPCEEAERPAQVNQRLQEPFSSSWSPDKAPGPGGFTGEMLMLNCNQWQQKKMISEPFQADPKVMMNYVGDISLCWGGFFPQVIYFLNLHNCIFCLNTIMKGAQNNSAGVRKHQHKNANAISLWSFSLSHKKKPQLITDSVLPFSQGFVFFSTCMEMMFESLGFTEIHFPLEFLWHWSCQVQ